MSEEYEGLLGGATNGAAQGSVAGPWGALAGALTGAIGGYLGGKSKKKARKRAEQRLKEALARLMAGSTDAYGNTLSADQSGRWSYNLGNAGNAAKGLAERALLSAKNYQNKTPRQIADDNTLIQALAEQQGLNAARSAISRTNLRTGSTMNNALANIARQSTQNLRNSYLQGLNSAKNSAQYNLNMRNNLSNAATNAMAPLNSMQSNLQSMVHGLNIPTYQASLGIANGINNLRDVNNTTNALSGVPSDLTSVMSNLFNKK